MIRVAVEKTLKGIHPLTISTVLVFRVVVALLWTMYNGVGGSVVPATPSASSIRIFKIKLRVVAPPECKYSVWTGMRRALPQGVVRQCRAVNRHKVFPEVSERMTEVPTTLALYTVKLRVVAPPE